MRFFDPTNTYAEKNCVKNHKKELLALGSRAFVITGHSSSKKNGSLDDVIAVLEEASVPYQIFNEIEENPSVETVVRAAEIGKEFKADFVIGIGGGSPLDASKAISLLIANPEETGDCFYVAKDLKTLPIAAVPTTCGTGSEVTPVSVLTRHDTQTKKSISYKIFPDIALIDGKYLLSASKNLLINTCVDALAHAAESRVSIQTNIYNQMFANYALKLWGDIVPFLRSDEELSEELAEKLMLTSTIAGMAKRIEQATGVETRASILGHMQRGGNPTAKDRVYASYMGALAVDLLCSGATNRVVGYRNGQYIDYDIEDALGMAKDVDQYEFEIAQILGR